LTPKKTDVTAREVNLLLKHFRELRNLAGKKLPNKNDNLWERAKKEARAELEEELKSRTKSLRPNQTIQKSTRAKQIQLQDRVNRTIEKRSEKNIGYWTKNTILSLKHESEKLKNWRKK